MLVCLPHVVVELLTQHFWAFSGCAVLLFVAPPLFGAMRGVAHTILVDPSYLSAVRHFGVGVSNTEDCLLENGLVLMGGDFEGPVSETPTL